MMAITGFFDVTQKLEAKGFIKVISEQWSQYGCSYPYQVWANFDSHVYCVVEGLDNDRVSEVRLWGNLEMSVANIDSLLDSAPPFAFKMPFAPEIKRIGVWAFSITLCLREERSAASDLESFLSVCEEHGRFVPWVKRPFISLVRLDEKGADYDSVAAKRLQLIERFKQSQV